jgi:ABC-type sugar transport system substrate-binding protein
MDESAKAEAQKLGLTGLRQYQSNGDVSKDVSNITSAVSQGAKAIIINPVNAAAATGALKQAQDKGVCVIMMYTNENGVPQDKVAPGAKAFIGWDDTIGAENLARQMAEDMGGKGGIVSLNGFPGDNSNTHREEVARAVWEKEYPGIKFLGSQPTNFDPAKARSVMQDYIQRYGDQITGVFAAADVVALAADSAIQGSPLRGKVVIGSAGAQKEFVNLMKQRTNYAAIPYIPRTEAALAVDLAAKCINGDKTPVVANSHESPVLAPLKATGGILTSQNADSYDPQF